MPRTRKRNYLYIATRIYRRADAGAMDDRQSEARPRDRARHRRADRQRPQAFHRKEMLHQDLRPANIMIDKHRHGEDHRFRLDPRRRRRRSRAGDRRRRHSRNGAIHRAGIFPRRRRHAALRHLFARRHRLSDADRPAALRRADGAGAHEIAAAQARLSPRRSTTAATFPPGSMTRCARPSHPTRRSATTSCRNSSTTCAIPTELLATRAGAAARAQSAAVLEGSVGAAREGVVLLLLALLPSGITDCLRGASCRH